MKDSVYLRCKNCECELDMREAKNGVLTCPYCRTVVVLPSDDSSDTTKAYLNSGNQNLELGRFDEAYIMFGKAVEENPKEPAGYFGMALSKAKIQYLKDIVNNKLQPICFEISSGKFTDDQNYQKAVELSNPAQKKIYIEKGQAIDNIKSKFFELKKNNVEYDTFICTKVTNEEGGNTQDSMNALKIYHELKDAGYKPFYSEEVLKNFVGEDYEANILYALYSSGSMLIVCSKEEYLQTKWVKNEYTRYISLLEQNEKQSGSIAFVYNGKPIEELPGIQGKVQGIDFSSFNALNQIMTFTQKYAGSNRFLDFQRKEYDKNSIQKKSTIKREIKKRNLNFSISDTVSISDEAKLSNAQKLLEKGDFVNVRNFCNEILMSNRFFGKAYWTLFLAENDCKSSDEFISSTTPISDFSNFEKAISTTSDKNERVKYYNYLKKRILESADKNDFEEYVALPEVEDKDICDVVDKMYNVAKERADKDLFDHAMSVEKNTNRYIRMNLGFLEVLPIEERKPYYENILNVDAANMEALYHNFNLENNLLNDQAIFDFYSDTKNHEIIENTLFAYGFNKFAANELSRIAQEGESSEKKGKIYDLILGMVPKGKNKLFATYLNQAINALFAGEKRDGKLYVDFEQLEKYNNALLTIDKYNCDCYINRFLIENKIKNPLELIDKNSLYDYNDFRLAINTFAERYPNKPNNFMQFEDELKEIKVLLSDPKVKQYVMDNYLPKVEWLDGKARADIIELLEEKMHKGVESVLQKNKCNQLDDLYKLKEDVTQDDDFVLARNIANTLSSKKETEEEQENTMANELNSISQRQPQVAKDNLDTQKKEEKKTKRKKSVKAAFWTFYAIGIFICVIIIYFLIK